MLGVLYILICFLTGFTICNIAFPNLRQLHLKTYTGETINIHWGFILVPAWYLVGTLCVTWLTYIVAYLFGSSETPLLYANAIVMPSFLVLSLLYCIYHIRRNPGKEAINFNDKIHKTLEVIKWHDMLFVAFITLLACILMWTTFFIKNNQLYVGVSVFSDFAPHLGMIRSFSEGNNFPTQYSHYAGQDIRYHFMFQFLTGNLEFLGMRLDFAFNVPSILSFVSVFLLLYVLAVKITGRKAVGYLAGLFFAFRSSESLLTFLSEIPKGTSLFKTITENMEFIGYTTHEEWGLWNLNVYCNQRHFAFSLAIIILVIMMFLPYLFHMFEDLNGQIYLEEIMQRLLFSRKAWLVSDWRLAVVSGILLGAIAFWNGAALIAALTILFFIALCSENRLDFLIMAVIAVTLSVLQSKFFIHGLAVSAQYHFGFIAENQTFFGVVNYLKKLLGILPMVLFAAFLTNKGAKRYLIFAFATPIIFAFTISLTVDVAVNHKYLMMGVMFLGIFVGSLIVKLFDKKDIWVRIGSCLIVLLLTATGIYDFTTVLRKNQSSNAIVLNMKDELTKWIGDNSDSKDIFLTSNYSLNRVVLGGAMLFEGWPYYAWSAGYDTATRDAQVKLMYEAATSEELITLAKNNKIRFIIVDHDNRESEAYMLNEDNINDTFECVYQDGDGEWTTSVYDTQKTIK